MLLRSAARTAIRSPLFRSPVAPPHQYQALPRAIHASGAASAKVGSVVKCNIIKNGKDPTVQEDSEYPEWLPGLTEVVSLKDLEKLVVAGGGPERCDPKVLKRYIKKKAKDNVKLRNQGIDPEED